MALIGLWNWSHVCYHCLLKGKKSNVLLVNVLHARMLEILGEPFILFTALLLAALPPPMIPWSMLGLLEFGLGFAALLR